MYRIFMNEKYISVLPGRYISETHSHELLQMFISCKEKFCLNINEKAIEGNCIIIDGNTPHHVTQNDPVDFLMFIEPTCSAANQLQYCFSDQHYIAYQNRDLQNLLIEFRCNPDQKAHQKFIHNLFLF